MHACMGLCGQPKRKTPARERNKLWKCHAHANREDYHACMGVMLTELLLARLLLRN